MFMFQALVRAFEATRHLTGPSPVWVPALGRQLRPCLRLHLRVPHLPRDHALHHLQPRGALLHQEGTHHCDCSQLSASSRPTNSSPSSLLRDSGRDLRSLQVFQLYTLHAEILCWPEYQFRHQRRFLRLLMSERSSGTKLRIFESEP